MLIELVVSLLATQHATTHTSHVGAALQGPTYRAECQQVDPNGPILYDTPLACVVPFVTGNASLRVTLQGPFETAQGTKTSLTCGGSSLFVAKGAVVNGSSAAVYGRAFTLVCSLPPRAHDAAQTGKPLAHPPTATL
jgi:hypothetical protein